MCYPEKYTAIQGKFSSTVVIGTIAVVQTILPLILRYVVVSDAVSSSSSTLYKYAWAGWVYGHLLIDGLLMILWPFSYIPIERDVFYSFYLSYYLEAGINGGVILYAILAIMFFVSTFSDGSMFWFGIYARVELLLLFGSYWFYPEAFKWYIPT